MSSHTELNDRVRALAVIDADVLVEKGKVYGDSWKKRGGAGAFFVFARKWDRLEEAAKASGWDVIAKARADGEKSDGLLEQIRDLRRYLFLLEIEVERLRDGESAIYSRTEQARPFGFDPKEDI